MTKNYNENECILNWLINQIGNTILCLLKKTCWIFFIFKLYVVRDVGYLTQ